MFYIHSIVTYANLFESFYFTERTSKHGELAHKCDDIVCECICWTLYCWPFLVSLAKCKQCFCFKSVIRHSFFSSVWVTNETWNIFNKETNVKQRTEFHDFFFFVFSRIVRFFFSQFSMVKVPLEEFYGPTIRGRAVHTKSTCTTWVGNTHGYYAVFVRAASFTRQCCLLCTPPAQEPKLCFGHVVHRVACEHDMFHFGNNLLSGMCMDVSVRLCIM